MITEIDLRNIDNLAAWRMRMALRRGSSYLSVDPYPDLRNADQIRRWRVIEFKRRRAGKKKAEVVNIAAWYLRRARNGRRSAIARAT